MNPHTPLLCLSADISRTFILLSVIIFLNLTICSTSNAEEKPTEWQDFVHKVATAKSSAALAEILEEAKGNGTPQDVIFESQLIRAFAAEDTEVAVLIAPEVRERMDKWNSKTTIFEEESEYLGFSHFALFLDEMHNNDTEKSKFHLSEAFWNLPAYARNFGEALSKKRAAERLGSLKLDLDLELRNSDGTPTTLRKLLDGNKALLLDFWASWCGPCISAMPALKKKSEALGPQGVVVVAMNTENDADLANETREELGMQKVAWLLDSKETPYGDRLEIKAIPCMVLIDPEGKVLFKGHPFINRRELAASLQKLDPKIQLPELEEEEE